VVAIRNVFTTVNNCYLVTELCEGGDLGARVRGKKMEEGIAISLFRDIFEGFRGLAAAGIHRHLKASNILLSKNHAKLQSFTLPNPK
jgi:serine/threonine protein kinase